MTRIALLTTTETDLLSARASGADYVYGNPAKLDVAAVETLIDGADLIVFRFLGGKEQLPATFTTCTESGLPLVVLGGQHTPDATLMELSSVPMGVAAQAHHYFVQGGVGNLRNVHAFLSDTVLLTGDAFEPVEQMPVWSSQYPGVENMHVAVMGCIVNGPGESKHADIGISLPGADESPVAPVFIDGERTVTLKGDHIAEEFQAIVENYVVKRYGKAQEAVAV